MGLSPECINFGMLENRMEELKATFEAGIPFRYVVVDGFCHAKIAVELARAFPEPDRDWIDASGINTRRKVTSPVHSGTLASQFFSEAQSLRFLSWLTAVTGIQELIVDESYFGAGFHQTRDGGYLNVHVDFNRLENGLDRRLNLLVYLNELWEARWGGEIELWDMNARKCFFASPPKFNRALLFETNEVSYHGQPNPVKTGGEASRNSFSVYYYTDGRPEYEAAPDHSTIYVNVHGLKGVFKNIVNVMRQTVLLRPLRRRLKRLWRQGS